MTRKGGVRRSHGSRGRGHGGLHGSRGLGPPRRAYQIDGAKADASAESHWVEWGSDLIWAVEFTARGAPIGLAASDFDPADLHALGLDADEVVLTELGDPGVGGLDVWLDGRQ